MKTILKIHHGLQNQIQNPNQLIYASVLKINTAIVTISATIASTS